MTVWYASQNPTGFRAGERLSIDEPCVTIMAHDMGGDGIANWRICRDGSDDRAMSTATNKPPYRVPTMAEIAELPSNGLSVVSTFSGCGGSCLGFKMAGYDVLWASEFIPAAQETYRANHPGTILDTRDIREVTPEEILSAIGKDVGEVDVMEGSPPCASFSTAGNRNRDWGKTKQYSDASQRTDDLFFEYIRLIDGIKPRVFVAENVSGLVKGVAKGYFKAILRAMRETGYRVEARLLDAQWLGVPQARQRIIFVGVRSDIERDPAFPTPLPYRYSVRDALPHIVRQMRGAGFGEGEFADAGANPSQTIGASPVSGNGSHNPSEIEARVAVRAIHDTSGEWSQGDITDRPAPAVTVGVNGMNSNHFQIEEAQLPPDAYDIRLGAHGFKEETVIRGSERPAPTVGASGLGSYNYDFTAPAEPEALLGDYAVGQEWDKLSPGEQSERYFNLVKPDPDKPSPTVTQAGGNASTASVTHPVERRKFTIAELRRICAFPDDFILTGSYAQQWERLGRSVPPLMMRAVAEVVRDEILSPCAE